MLAIGDVLSHVSFILVFIEGLLSFFSPCVIPLLPLYMGYLAGHSNEKGPHPQRRVLLFTFCFILGIFSAIFLMNLSMNLISKFFQDNMTWFIRIGGIFIILLGIHQLGLFHFDFLQRTFKFGMKPKKVMNIFIAFLLGFTFSFAWTPCIGPALSGILLLANSAQSFWLSNLLMLTYTLGLTIPFLILGIFTNRALSWIASHKKIMNYTVKIGAVILILMGLMMFTGKMNVISNYMSADTVKQEDTTKDESKTKEPAEQPSTDSTEEVLTFTLQDQHGKTVSFEDYRGKVILLNFWATWCPPCMRELPHIQELYEKYKDSEDVAVLTVVFPGSGQEKSADGINAFLDENNYDVPVLFDDGTLTSYFTVSSLPTTYMIQKDGTVFGYVKGQLTNDMMEQIISKTLTGKK